MMNDSAAEERLEFEWQQPKWTCERYRLRRGEMLLGEMVWRRWFSDEALARVGEDAWLLDRRGFLRDRVVAYERESGALAASFIFGWMVEGEMRLPGGRRFDWRRASILGQTWALLDEAGETALELELWTGWFKRQASLRVSQSRAAGPDAGLLLSLAMYLALCAQQNAAGAAAVVTTACI